MRVLVPGPLDGELLHGRTLRAHAAQALESADVPDEVTVVHDASCPLVPPSFIGAVVQACQETGRPAVAVRPVTDTVKLVEDGMVGATVDRDGLWQLAAPIALPPGLTVTDGGLLTLVGTLEDPVLVEAPALARRVTDPSELRLLAALT